MKHIITILATVLITGCANNDLRRGKVELVEGHFNPPMPELINRPARAAMSANEVSSVPAPRVANLTWNYNSYVEFYTVRIDGTNILNIDVPPVPLVSIFAGIPNGEYRLTVTATANDLTSEPSEPLAVFWYGNTPVNLELEY